MGMFDSVIVRCPVCGKSLEFQSKADECLLTEYTINSAPQAIQRDIADDEQTCSCGLVIGFELSSRLLIKTR